MKKKFLLPFFLAILVGFVFAQAVYKEYMIQTENISFNTYILQEGVYTNKEALDKHLKDIDKYILYEEDGKYYVYLAFTTSLNNVNKLKSLYEEEDVSVYVRKANILNDEFVASLEQYDLLLEEVKDDEEIFAINETILSSYEELILGK